MANDNHLFSIPCYNETMLTKDYYNDFSGIGQQKINFNSLKNGADPKIRTKGILHPKIERHQKRKVIPQESELHESLNSAGLFCICFIILLI